MRNILNGNIEKTKHENWTILVEKATKENMEERVVNIDCPTGYATLYNESSFGTTIGVVLTDTSMKISDHQVSGIIGMWHFRFLTGSKQTADFRSVDSIPV